MRVFGCKYSMTSRASVESLFRFEKDQTLAKQLWKLLQVLLLYKYPVTQPQQQFTIQGALK